MAYGTYNTERTGINPGHYSFLSVRSRANGYSWIVFIYQLKFEWGRGHIPESGRSNVEMTSNRIKIYRAPVVTLRAAVVAERLGYDSEAALTLGNTVAGLNAQSKGQRLGIYGPKEEKETEA